MRHQPGVQKARGMPLDPRDQQENHPLEKRAFDPCAPEDYSIRPTATVYTSTAFSTSTVSFTSTETDTATSTTTITVAASAPIFVVSGTSDPYPTDSSHCDFYRYTTAKGDHQNYTASPVDHHYHRNNHGYKECSWRGLSP